jgi:hypothetical protein
VARDVLDVIRWLFREPPSMGWKPIVCFHNPAYPIADVSPLPVTYRIGVAVTDRFYAQFAYHLGHELGHIMFDPRRTNGLLEVLATAVSLEVLDVLADWWAVAAPYPHWTPYAPRFREYRESTESSFSCGFPPEVRDAIARRDWSSARLYLRYRRADQDTAHSNRELNHLGAIALRSAPVDWSRFVGIGSRTIPPPSTDPSFRMDLPVDGAEVQDLLSRIGRGCSSPMLIATFDARPCIASRFLFQDADGRWVLLAECIQEEQQALEAQVRRCSPRDLSWD